MITYYSVRASRSAAFIILLFIVMFALTAAKPFHLDNTDFPAVAKRTAESGLPIYYRGEDERNALGLFHPPLYIYSLAAWMRVFGPSEASVRLFGMICALLQGLVVLEILRSLFGAKFWKYAIPWFWALFLLAPYTVQTAGIADIDSTIYGPLLCLALLAAVQMNWRDGVWKDTAPRFSDYALLAAILTLCLWAKLTTVFLVFPFLFLLFLHRLGFLRSVLATIALTVGSCAGFAITYWLYGKLTGIDINYTYAFTWMSFVTRGSSGKPGLSAHIEDFRKNFEFMRGFTFAWTGILPWIAVIAALAWFGVRAVRLKDRRAFHYCVILALAFLTTIYYCGKVITFGGAPFRYNFVYWGIIITAPLVLVIDGLSPQSSSAVFNTVKKTPRVVLGLAMVVLVPFLFGLAPVHDLLILASDDAWKSVWLLFPAMLFGAAAVGLRYDAALSRLGMGIALLFFIGFDLGVALYQSKANYATTYDYGQTGFVDTVGFIRTETGPNDLISCMKDIGIKSERRFIENYPALYGDQAAADRLIQAIADGKVRYEVFTEGKGQDQLFMNPKIQSFVNRNCELVRSIGNYRIYQYKRPQLAQQPAASLKK